MALSDSYFDLDAWKLKARKTTDVDDDQILQDAFTISRWLDTETLRASTGYWHDTSPVARSFTTPSKLGRGVGDDWPYVENPFVGMARQSTLYVDDFCSVPTLVRVDMARDGSFNTSLTNVTHYQLLPRNAPLRPEAWPYTALSLVASPNNQFRNFPAGVDVEITAQWGWPGSPPQAIYNLVQEYIRIWRAEGPRATIEISQIAGMIKASPEAVNILERVKRRYTKAINHFG